MYYVVFALLVIFAGHFFWNVPFSVGGGNVKKSVTEKSFDSTML